MILPVEIINPLQPASHPNTTTTTAIMLLKPISSPPPPRLGSRYLLLVPLLVITQFLSFLSFSDAAACNPLDQASLLSFSESFPQLINWFINSQSQQVNCCSWFGIACDVNDRVTALSLPSLGLCGLISPSILNLTNLSHLNLSHNFLSDHFFLLLNRLQVIDLSYNHLSGHYPTTIPCPLASNPWICLAITFMGESNLLFSRSIWSLLTLATTPS